MTECFNHSTESEIIGSKIVTPLADAMSFINNKQRGLRILQSLQYLWIVELFGREKQEIKLLLFQSLERFLPLSSWYGRVEHRHFTQILLGDRLSLIALQGKQ